MSELISEQIQSLPTDAPQAEPPAAEPAWEGPTQDEWSQMTQAIGYLAQNLPQPEPEPQQPQAPQTTFDPFSDDPTGQLREIIRQELAPVAAYQQYEQQAEAEERAYDILDDISSRVGGVEIENRDTVFPIMRAWADTKMPEMAQRHGWGPKAAEAALEAAYSDIQALLSAFGEGAVTRHMNQLHTLGGARQEPAAYNGATQTTELPTGGDEMSVVHRWGGGP